MAKLTLAELERSSYLTEAARRRNELSEEQVGDLLALVWSLTCDDSDRRPFPSRQALATMLSSSDVPSSLRSAVVFQDRIDGPVLDSYTRMVNSAQQSGYLRRVNPEHVRVINAIKPLEARHLLQPFVSSHRSEVEWLMTALRRIAGLNEADWGKSSGTA